MSMKLNVMTLEEYLSKRTDEELMQVEYELFNNVAPATGYAHAMIRRINRLIDKGELCFNPMTYRKVYLPTFARAVHKEMARRYYNFVNTTGGYYA